MIYFTKKYVFWITIPFLFFVSCLDPNLPNVNGMWQLKTIQDENKNIQKVDTIFYSFQRQAIFSYTILTGTSSDLPVIYGYVDFPAKDKLHIQLDRMYEQTSEPDRMLWKGMQTEYDILKLTSKEMILEQEGKLFNFIKF